MCSKAVSKTEVKFLRNLFPPLNQKKHRAVVRYVSFLQGGDDDGGGVKEELANV